MFSFSPALSHLGFEASAVISEIASFAFFSQSSGCSVTFFSSAFNFLMKKEE